MVNLTDIRTTLLWQIAKDNDLPCHVGAFMAWVMSDNEALREYIEEASGFTGQMRRPEHVAALGYGAASALLTLAEDDLLTKEIAHLSGREFFAPGRPLRFEVDGIALLGVSLGVAAHANDNERQWMKDLLARSTNDISGDPWQLGLLRAAQQSIGEPDLRIVPPDLAVAMVAKGIGVLQGDDLEAGWKMAVRLEPHNSGPARDAIRLTVFENGLARQGQIAIAAITKDDLISLLQNISRSMRLWTFESVNRTRNSAITKWEIENEYHVQNLIWTVLAPVFSDLEDEENLPSVGHKNPRADLGIRSLRTIIEVKFLRNSGQAACAKIIEEIAADASLYLSKPTAYDNIIAFVWDDCAQTEQHHELKSGLEAIMGITGAIILPRPSKMRRS
jgi:REase_DpnII-MboI